MNLFLKIVSIISVIAGVAVATFFFVMISDDYQVFGNNTVLLNETGLVGDFVGGVIGTIFSLAGFFLLVLTLNEQNNFANKERFESKFFDLLKLHRENVRELEKDNVSGRKEFHLIFKQFLECRDDLKPVFRKANKNDIYETTYIQFLESNLKQVNKNIDIVDLAKLNLPYLVTFYGVGAEGKEAIIDILGGKYKTSFIEFALNHIAMKPIKASKYYKNWSNITKLQFKYRARVTNTIVKLRNKEKVEKSIISDLANQHFYSSNYIKYYGGHQYQLGHYFRHLFQSFSFINNQKSLNQSEKYFYAKTLRAQLSTSEQYLLFINSLSVLGFVWDLIPEMKNVSWYTNVEKYRMNKRLISKYNLIKNIPGKVIFGISFRHYYPDVEYEHMR